MLRTVLVSALVATGVLVIASRVTPIRKVVGL